MTRILVHQLEPSPASGLLDWLAQEGYQVAVSPSPTQQASRPIQDVDVVLIDASGGGDVAVACHYLGQAYLDHPLILLATPQFIPNAECRLLTYNNIIHHPFTFRAVTDRIQELLARPWYVLRVGEISLNLRTGQVFRSQQCHRLTPKQARLLQVFMCYAGQTLPRKFLMETIWNTDYMGDTRTLDVHVRWIRECIEENPSAPQYLRTVRGIGYRFGIPPDATHGEPALPDSPPQNA